MYPLVAQAFIYAFVVFFSPVFGAENCQSRPCVPLDCQTMLIAGEALAFQRISEKRDHGRTKHLNHDQRRNFEVIADPSGRVIYRLSSEKIDTGTDFTFLAVWTIENDGPGQIYGVLDDEDRQSEEYKHSSFNSNKPVLGAWSMKIDTGLITEINDGSGHYKPTPLNIYFVAKQLQLRGFDLSQTKIVFEYGLEDIGGLKISAHRYIEIMERLPQEQREDFDEVTFYRKNLREFLILIQRYTEDQKTRALIDLYFVRYSNTVSELAEKSLIHLADYLARNPQELDFVCARIFKNKSIPHFAYRPVYFDLTTRQTNAVVKRYLEILLENSKDSMKSEIKRWLKLNT